MKTIFKLLLLLQIGLFARENPFEPTVAYEEEIARMQEMQEIEEEQAVEFQKEQQYVNEIYEKMNNPNEEKPKKPALTEEKVKKLIEKAKKENVKKTKEIVKKAVEEKPKQVEQVVFVKPRLDVLYEKQILPFVKVEYDNDKIDILSDYKVSKKLTLPGEKKIILDYTAEKNFYTVRQNLESTSFLKVIVGNHQKEKFFRIVVELAQLPQNYEVSYTDNKVSIVKLYSNE